MALGPGEVDNQLIIVTGAGEMKFIDLKLPPLTEYVHRIKFLSHEQEKYDAKALIAAKQAEDLAKQAEDAADEGEREALLARADAAGIKVDRRWGLARLRAAVDG